MQESIRSLRIKIDALAQLTKELKSIRVDGIATPEARIEYFKDFPDKKDEGQELRTVKLQLSKEVQKAYDSLILAKAWLGKILGEMGESTPYVNDGNRKDIKDIEPTADKSDLNGEATKHNFNMFTSHIEKVDWLREEIKNITQETHVIRDYFEYRSQNDRTCWENVYTYLCEARFWLGFELGRIRDGQTEYNVYI